MRALVVFCLIACGSKSGKAPPSNTTSTTAAAAAEVGATSKADLGKRALDAIKARSTESLVSLASTMEVIEALCPENIERDGREVVATRITERRPRYAAAIEACWALGKLEDAVVVSSEELDSRKIEHCKDQSTIGGMAYEIKAGTIQLTMMVKWLEATSGRVYLDLEPECMSK